MVWYLINPQRLLRFGVVSHLSTAAVRFGNSSTASSPAVQIFFSYFTYLQQLPSFLSCGSGMAKNFTYEELITKLAYGIFNPYPHCFIAITKAAARG
jgi:hypothetical protein